ncbi:MAG: fructokinase [Actinomycetota bacterium]|nr:fructokinase [Actinomycetota bacterium]
MPAHRAGQVGPRPKAEPFVVVVGDACIDEVRLPGGAQFFPGGSALNVAVGLSTLGVSAALVAMVGDDADGDLLRDYLQLHRVELLVTPSGRGTARAISERMGAEPRYSFTEAAIHRRIELGDAEVATIEDASLVVLSGFPFDDTQNVKVLQAAVRSPLERLVIDANPRAGLLRDAATFTRNLEDLAATSRLAKIGEEDAALLWGRTLDEVTQHLLDLGTDTVLSTAGERGAMLSTSTGIRVRAAATDLAEPIMDTMGAGDATLASVAHSLVSLNGAPDEQTWTEILGDAMAVAAATCRAPGGSLCRPHPRQRGVRS